MRRLWRIAFPLLLASLSATAAAHEVVPPKPIEQPAPVWPSAPLPHDLVVPMVVTVGLEGQVEKVVLEASIEPQLDAAAVAAVKQWRFEPARDAEGPVRARIRVLLRFEGRPRAPERPEDDEHLGEPHLVDEVVEVTVREAEPARAASQTSRERDVLGATLKQSGSELLRAVPGLNVTQHSGAGKAHQIYYRGFDAVHGQDLEIQVGGLPINEVSNVHGQGYADLSFVIPETVERIDALPGAFDPRQGDFAVAGSLRFRLGLAEEGFAAKGSYGRFGTHRAYLGYRPSGMEGTFAAFEHWGTSGFGPARAARRTNVTGQVSLELAPGWTGRLLGAFHAGRFDSAGVVRQRDLDRAGFDRFTSYDPDQGGDTTRALMRAEMAYEDEVWRLSLAPFVQRRTMRLQFNFTGALIDPERGDNAIQRHRFTEVGLQGAASRALPIFSDGDRLEVGVFARHDLIKQGHEPRHGEGPAFVDASIAATNLAGYADLRLRPISRLQLRGGLRVDGLFFSVEDRLADDTGDRAAAGVHLGPKATADVAILPELHALASYGKGFRSPQARSQADGESTPFTDVHSFEVGLRYQRGDMVLLGAGYASLLSDDLVFNETTSRNEPVPATLRVGGSLDLQQRLGELLVHAFGVSYTRASFRGSDARFAEGDLVPFVPQLILRSDLAVTPELTELWDRKLVAHLGAGVDYLFRRPLPFGEIGTDILLVDASAGLRLGEVELRVDALNLLDAAYNDAEFVYASSFGSTSLIPRRHASVGAPLTVMGTLGLYL